MYDDPDEQAEPIRLEDVLEEIDPELDGTMQGTDDGDPHGLDLPPRPAPGPPVRDARPDNRRLYLVLGALLALVVLLVGAAWQAGTLRMLP